MWPQPAYKLGKILFYTTRVAMVMFIVAITFSEIPTYATIDPKTCFVLGGMRGVCNRVISASSEAIFWLCLYALLGGRKAFFAPLLILFLAFHISINVAYWYPKTNWSYHAIPQSKMDAELGYACTWSYLSSSLHPPTQRKLALAVQLLSIAKMIVTLAMTLGAMFVAYKGQRGKLITVIRREGAIFYLVSLAVLLLASLATLIGSKFEAFQVAMQGVERIGYLRVILAERLLLLLKQAQDPGATVFAHSIAFAPTQDSELEPEYDNDGLGIPVSRGVGMQRVSST